MKVYRVSPDQLEFRRRRAVKEAAVLAVFIGVLPLVITEWMNYRRHRFNYPLDIELILLLVGFAVAMGGLLIWSVFRAIRKARRDVDQALSVEITVDESYVTKRQDGGIEIKLAFPEIRRIEQQRKVFVLRTDSPGKSIVVPESIEGYDRLKTELMQRSAAPLVEPKHSLWGWLGVAAFLSAIELMAMDDRRWVTVAAGFMIVFLAWGVLHIARDQNITRKLRRQIVLGLLIGATACLARVWMVWSS